MTELFSWPDFEIIISLITIIDSKVFVRQLGLSLFRQLDNWRETKLQVNEVARSFFIRHIEGLLLISLHHILAGLGYICICKDTSRV